MKTPTCLSTIRLHYRKKFNLFLFILIVPGFLSAQSLTGLWTGVLSNDSNTTRKDQSFEIALTEYKGKVYGYSRSEFIVDDVLYYTVKRVKGTITGDICEVKDDEIIAYNFPGKLDKGVKVTSTFKRNQADNTWYLDGSWKTNTTKNYYAVTGKVALQEEKDLTASKIFPHLEELKLANDVAFYREREEGLPIMKIARPEKIATATTSPAISANHVESIASLVKSPPVNEVKKSEVFEQSILQSKANTSASVEIITAEKQINSSVVTENVDVKTLDATSETSKPITTSAYTASSIEKKNIPTNDQPVLRSTASNPMAVTKKAVVKNSSTITPGTSSPLPTEPVNSEKNNIVKSSEVVANNSANSVDDDISNSNDVVLNRKPVSNPVNSFSNPAPASKTNNGTTAVLRPTVVTDQPILIPTIPSVKKSLAERNGAAEFVNDRISEISQIVEFSSDSLELALYDNGQVDGDTVSVIMNGEVILAKQGLKASAIRKTIYVPSGSQNVFTIVLYAENLGAFPPNTGLLVVKDGDDIYNLRFSADLQKNTGIVFRRKSAK